MKKLLGFLWIVSAVAAFAVYYNALSNGLIWDDPIVLKNQLSAFRSVKDIFFPPVGIPQFGIHYYRPLIILSFLIDKKLWGGSSSSPFVFHFSVVIFHVINTVLVFFLARWFLGKCASGDETPRDSRARQIRSSLGRHASGDEIAQDMLASGWFRPKKGSVDLGALMASLFFAVHPIHTESVAWMAGRSDVLAAVFFFASLLLYIGYRERIESGQAKRIPASCLLFLSSLAFLLSAFAKETALSLVFLLPVVNLTFSQGGIRQAGPGGQEEEKRKKEKKGTKKKQREIMEKRGKGFRRGPSVFMGYIPFLIAGVVYFLMRHAALKEPAKKPLQSGIFLELPRNFINSYGFYLEKLFLPVNLKAYLPEVPSGVLYTLISVVVLIALAALAVWSFMKARKILFFSIAFFFLTLLPSIMVAIIKVSETPLAERYLYIPSFSLSLMAGFLFLAVPGGWKEAAWIRRSFSAGILVVLIAVAAAFSAQTVLRNPVWRDDLPFWEDISRKLPDEGLPHLNLGLTYSELGREEEAEREYIKAINVKYDDEGRSTAYNNLGNIYMGREEFDRAGQCFQTAISIRANYATPYYSMGLNSWKKFHSTRKKGQPDARLLQQSVDYLQKAINLNPQYVKAHGLLGNIYLILGKHRQAREHLETVLRYEQEGSTAEGARELLKKIPSP